MYLGCQFLLHHKASFIFTGSVFNSVRRQGVAAFDFDDQKRKPSMNRGMAAQSRTSCEVPHNVQDFNFLFYSHSPPDIAITPKWPKYINISKVCRSQLTYGNIQISGLISRFFFTSGYLSV